MAIPVFTLIAISLPVLFICILLLVTGIIGLASGWFALAKRYPDKPETAVLTMPYQSGYVGPVRVNRALRLSTCRSGLRVGIPRVLFPLSRDFLVPWTEIAIVRRDAWLAGSQLEFRFGTTGRITIPAFIADKLAASVPDAWPEKKPSEP